MGWRIQLRGGAASRARYDSPLRIPLPAIIRRASHGKAGVSQPQPARPDVETLLREGDSLRDQGSAAEAAQAYRAVLALAPERTEIRVQLGNMLKDSGRLPDAEAAYRHALGEEPGNADIHLQLGHVLKLMGRRSAALEAYRAAVALAPDSRAALHELAEAGEADAQERRFEAQLGAGGIEALLAMSRELVDMRAKLDRMIAALPDAQAQAAWPIGLYGRFRELFRIPEPPPAPAQSFTVLLLADREPMEALYAQLAGLQGQAAPAWTLRAIGRDPDRRRVVELSAARDARVTWVEAGPDEPAASAELRAAAAAATDWIVLLAEGAVLDRHALGWIAAAAGLGGAPAFIADEEGGIRRQGRLVRSAPVLRQVVDYDTLIEANVFGETVAIRAGPLKEAIPRLLTRSVTACRSSLLLELCARGGVGHIPWPLVWRTAPPPSPILEHRAAVAAHLAGRGGAGTDIGAADAMPALWHPQRPDAPITVIIPTRDNGPDLRTCVASLRETAAVPAALHIVVVDNGSREAATRSILQELAQAGTRLLALDEPFNWSRLNNQAAAGIDTPLIVFANDDMRMTTPGWDMRLRGLLERPEIGAVGARLLYEDDTLQHAGILFGWKGSVIHDGLHERLDAPGPAARWHVSRSAGAVTGAFLATRRELFMAQGGFDEIGLPVAYSDVDYALRLREAGLRVLWTPGITLYHHESKTRGLDRLDAAKAARNDAERDVMEARWADASRPTRACIPSGTPPPCPSA